MPKTHSTFVFKPEIIFFLLFEYLFWLNKNNKGVKFVMQKLFWV